MTERTTSLRRLFVEETWLSAEIGKPRITPARIPQSPLCARPLSPGDALADDHLALVLAGHDRSMRPSPITARPWKSSPTVLRPVATSESRWPPAERSTRPSPITARPWKSSPTTRRPTTTSAPPWPAAEGRQGHRPLPQGPKNQARLRVGPQQPRPRLGRPRTGCRGDHPLP